ncbi:MAG: hypothetical protein IJ877_04440 [Candidatus Gastranaerophilales bacterium]|nr:hypothetical protein [Candidatus Gastranaerophilales bacterium]
MKFINFLNRIKYFIIFLLLGLLLFFHKALINNFDLLFGGYDNLYCNYVLEHSFLWLKGVHSSFWSAPFNYYDAHSIAQFDSFIGVLPFYWFLRMFIKDPLNAFRILFVFVSVLNYVSFYYLLKCLKIKSLASSLGAFIFAFCVLRYFNFDNFGSFTQFLSIISVIFLFKIKKENKSIVNHFYFLLFSLFLILQFYTSFQIGFFTVFCLFFATIFSLLPKNSRDIVIVFLKDFYKYILFYALIIFLSLFPMMYQFSCIEYFTPLSTILGNIANYSIWFRSLSVLDNLIKFNFDFISYKAQFSSMSFGIITTIIAIFALFKTTKIKGVSLLTLFFILLISSGQSAIYFWNIFYYFSFGIESIDSVYCISFMALVIVSLGIALFVNNTDNKIVLILAVLFVTIEQIPHNSDFYSSYKNYYISKKEFISSIKKLNVEDSYIYVKYKPQNSNEFGKIDKEIKDEKAQKIADIKAMWLGLELNKPVTNNYIKKSKSQNTLNIKAIDLIVDYNQI